MEQEKLKATQKLAIEKSRVNFESSIAPSHNEPMISEDEYNSIPVENLPDITLPSQIETNMNQHSELVANGGHFSESDQADCESDLQGNYKTHVKKNGTVVFTKNFDNRPKRDRKRPMPPPPIVEYSIDDNA